MSSNRRESLRARATVPQPVVPSKLSAVQKKALKEEAVVARRVAAEAAVKRIAQAEDDQALHDKALSSFSPDRQENIHLPSKHPVRRGGNQIGAKKPALPLTPSPAEVYASPTPIRSFLSPAPSSHSQDGTPVGILGDDIYEEMVGDDVDIPDISDYATTSASEPTTDADEQECDNFGPLWKEHNLDEDEDGEEDKGSLREKRESAMMEDDDMSSSAEYERDPDYSDGVATDSEDDLNAALAKMEAKMIALKAKQALKNARNVTDKKSADTHEKPKQKPIKPIVDKMATRKLIMGERKERSDTMVAEPKLSKRKEPEEGDGLRVGDSKRTRTAGGLAQNWRTLTTAATKVKKPQLATRTPPEAKKGIVKAQTPAVILKEADVQAIDKKERTRKPNYKVTDLPFRNHAADYQKWTAQLIPSLLDWAASESVPEPFTPTTGVKSKTEELWALIYKYLPAEAEDGDLRISHPAIYSLASGTLRTHRSAVGKRGFDIVSRTVLSYSDTSDERRRFVEDQLNDERFLYGNPDADVDESAGLGLGPMVLETFSYHLRIVSKATTTHGFPFAALAIACCAVKRGLMLWSDGTKPDPMADLNAEADEEGNQPKKKRRNDPQTAFTDDPWGTEARQYFQEFTELLDDDGWKAIITAALTVSRKGKTSVKTEVDDVGALDTAPEQSEPKKRRLRV